MGTAQTGYPRTSLRIVDISATGALIETEAALPVGDSVDLDLELGNGAVAQVRARVARVLHLRFRMNQNRV
ncbi:MAG: PilZ domain-containing protein [bacterium]|nr:PilZ domain-containing protein [bacterium]